MNLAAPFRATALALLGAACLIAQTPAATPAPTYPPSIGQLVAKAKAEIKLVNLADFKAAFDRKEAGLILDVREPDDYLEGHVAGAVNLPRGLAEFGVWKLVGFPDKTDQGRKITVYCQSGGRAALTTRTLRDLGFTNVVAFDGKFEDWKKAGYPVEN